MLKILRGKVLNILVSLSLLLPLIVLPFVAPALADQAAVFTVGSTTYTVNGQPQQMDVAPFEQNGLTYVPVRYLAYALGIPATHISSLLTFQTSAHIQFM